MALLGVQSEKSLVRLALLSGKSVKPFPIIGEKDSQALACSGSGTHPYPHFTDAETGAQKGGVNRMQT